MAQHTLGMGGADYPTLDELRELRSDAEQHLDLAQEALFDDDVSDTDALAHLDNALACVTSMVARTGAQVKAA